MGSQRVLAVTLDDPTDQRDRAFRDHLLDHVGDTALGQSWMVYECVRPACGCGCRRYLPAATPH